MNCFKAHKKRDMNSGQTTIQALTSSPYQSRKRRGFGNTANGDASAAADALHNFTLQRPTQPPPPPPIKASIAVDPGTSNGRLNSSGDNLSWKFEEFDFEEEDSGQHINYSSYSWPARYSNMPELSVIRTNK
ncbi:hypothetical protein KIN20_023471 [Parelaphostrongylus tenuis]|uniref:Uncharacterized protein n=1 Tax=Parelaphostrongylus tenuis TaxID=148309 RepID=A0AAD5MS19_PARTN|nr:hypothetical protein KIN20_023471 [Parelaphostrongylus tenuis]